MYTNGTFDNGYMIGNFDHSNYYYHSKEADFEYVIWSRNLTCSVL